VVSSLCPIADQAFPSANLLFNHLTHIRLITTNLHLFLSPRSHVFVFICMILACLNCMCRRGLVGDHERLSSTAPILSKGLENWGDQAAAATACMAGMKEASSLPQGSYNFYGSHHHGDHEMPAGGAKSQLSQMLLASSPRSCVTTSLGSNMLDFSNSVRPEMRRHHHNSDNSSEVRSAGYQMFVRC
jgi:hypothetical protein